MAENDDQVARETLNRNWDELLQELRVTQTGVQILTAFLLTVPFTNGFPELDPFQRDCYLVVLSGSVLTTALVVAPVAYHRVLFRQRQRRRLVDASHVTAQAGLVTLAATMAGVVFLVFDVVTTRPAALVALVIGVLLFGALWLGAPVYIDRSRPRR
jgi:L-asparagine transporter-like permease